MGHQALMEEEMLTSDNPEFVRQRRLKAVRNKVDKEMADLEQQAFAKGDFSQISKIYGRKHKKMRDWEKLQKQQAKLDKREVTGRKYHQRMKKNQKSLALMGEKRSSSIEPTPRKRNSDNVKRPKSARQRNTVNLPVFDGANSNEMKGRKGKKKVSFAVDTSSDVKSNSASPIVLSQHAKSDSSGSIVLHSGATPKLDAMSPLEIGYNVSDEDNDLIIAITPDVEMERGYHHLAQSSSLSLDTSWIDTENEEVDIGQIELEESSSSELTFSDDGNEDENDEAMVPLGVQMIKEQENHG